MNLKLLQTYGKRLIKSELIEINVPAAWNKGRIQLPDNQNIRDSYIWHIQAFNNIDMPISIIDRKSVISNALFKSTFLTLQAYNGDNFEWQSPLIDLRTTFNMKNAALADGTNLTTEMDPQNYIGQRVNWPNSYVEFADLTLIDGASDRVIPLEIYYSDLSAEVRAADKRASFKKRS